ncbi:Usherin [Varanus komodoensis]|nr:Usherin [Varanus komodoensis]
MYVVFVFRWKAPEEINGNLHRYILYIANNETNITKWNAIFNSTDLFQDFTIQHLSPGTKYFIKLAACTGGGCTISETNSAVTTESTPEGIPAPEIQSYSSDSFNISWTKPEYPNVCSVGRVKKKEKESSRKKKKVANLPTFASTPAHCWLQICSVPTCVSNVPMKDYSPE